LVWYVSPERGLNMPDVGGLARFWKAGAVLLAGVALALAGMGMVVAVVLALIFSLFGGNEDSVITFTLLSLPAWGPIALAYLLRAMPSNLRSEVWS
jgi:hypothetical protein